MWKNLMLPVRARPAFRWVPQIDMKAYDFDCTNFRKTLGSLVISSTTVILVWLKSGNVGSEVPKPFFSAASDQRIAGLRLTHIHLER
jgi:hypothetical protein